MSNKTAAILAASAVLVGVLIGRASADSGGAPKPAAEIEQAKGDVPDPKAYPRTMKGAASAAQAYNEALFRGVVMTADQRRGVIEAISSDAMRDQIAKDEEQTVEVAAKLFDLPKDEAQVVARVAPLGWRVVSLTNDSARVEIWSASVLGKPGVGHGPITQFATSTVDLAFERGAWRLAGTPESKDGPTPTADNPQVSSELLAAVKDLQEFSHVAR